MPTQPTNSSPGDSREIRLALVCYGGVSLAIYMHGMTKELLKLVIASRALADGATDNPFPRASTESVYWQVLREVQQQSGVLPRVVIDVVAGTSAGGINGIILCKALAHNQSQDALRDLWFERGDIKELLGGSWLEEGEHVAKFLLSLRHGTAIGPLDGQAMLGWLLRALEEMEKKPAYRPEQGPTPASLMPDGHELQLFVTTTDATGYRQTLTIADPPSVSERRNRHIFPFRYLPGEGHDDFGPGYNGALALAARATSSFPGAFPPLRLRDLPEGHRLTDALRDQIFAPYKLAGAEVENTCFLDGGVLNNYPFKPAVNAIVKLRAESEVSRYLLYLQPDPDARADNPEGELPNYFATVWAGLSGIASSQPILEELLAARTFNEQVRRIEELVDRMRDTIDPILEKELSTSLADQLEDKTPGELGALRDHLDQVAEDRGDFLFDPYLQIRAHSIVEQFATAICQLCGYLDAESNLAYLIRLIIDLWARRNGLIGDAVDPDERRRLLNFFDLGYTRRRFAFVLQGVNQLYHPKEGQPAPPRDSLNRAKRALYDGIDELKRGIDASSEALSTTMRDAVSAQFRLALNDRIAGGDDLGQIAEEFVAQNGKRLDELFVGLQEPLRAFKSQAHVKLYGAFQEITRNWDPANRRDVMLRYLGFPFWDAMIYPATRLSEAGELRPLQIVRMSPADSTRLGKSTAKEKLKGVQLGHFGAFFKREWRENDYLWGRLDAAERLVGLLLKDAKLTGSQDWIGLALQAVLAEEKDSLKTQGELLEELAGQLAAP
jgi:patatin-related protein